MLWLGLDGDLGPLHAVAVEAEAAAQRAGFELEGRPFHAHLTLSRIRPPVDVGELIDAVEPLRLPLSVDAVTLYRSVLGRGPARYEVVDVVDL